MNRLLIFLLILCTPLLIHAQEMEDDESQAELRLNPEITDENEIKVNYSDYPFLNLAANHISMNGADWSGLKRKVLDSQMGDGITSIVYLGDSHIQADFGGAVLRKRVGEELGEAGRGIVIPFKAAGTNEPLDYSFQISGRYASSKLMKQPWATVMPFSGIGIEPLERDFGIVLTCRTPFDRLTFFYEGEGSIEIMDAESCGEKQIYGAAMTDEGVYEIAFRELLEEVSLTFVRNGDVTLAGVSMSSDITGSYVHSVGNNGATYSSYNNIPGFGRELSVLEPDLVIIALGTNEAFGTVEAESLLYNIDELINTVRAHNPGVQVLLVTPSECHRRIYTRRKGSRRRTSTLSVNPKVEQVRNIIMKYASDNGIPVYDTFDVIGCAADQRDSGLLSKDGVHFTANGYRLLGNLLSDALLDELIDK